MKRLISATLLTFLLSGCLDMPDSVVPVKNFELERYLGTWYEIARLDHSFERGLEQVTAHYSLRDDGGVRVLNKGYSTADKQWQEAEGRAYFVESTDTAYLKVSFFGPFYGSYVVFELETEGYEYAFVSGPDIGYLWLLSRTPTVAPDIMNRFITMSRARGFDTPKLIQVNQ
jgi:apolipoprotein D and lipocalin family protein